MNAEKHNKLIKIMHHMSDEDKEELKESIQELVDATLNFKSGQCEKGDVDLAASMYQRLVDIKIAKTERELRGTIGIQDTREIET